MKTVPQRFQRSIIIFTFFYFCFIPRLSAHLKPIYGHKCITWFSCMCSLAPSLPPLTFPRLPFVILWVRWLLIGCPLSIFCLPIVGRLPVLRLSLFALYPLPFASCRLSIVRLLPRRLLFSHCGATVRGRQHFRGVERKRYFSEGRAAP